MLSNLEKATFTDLLHLVNPRNPADKAWALDAIAKYPDPVIRDFWLDEWYKRKDDAILRDSQAFRNRMREIMTPESSRYMINQETSAFDPFEVINSNKILLINLAGVPEQVASIIGSSIVPAIWHAAKRSSPERANFMFLDEFQQFSHLSSDFKEMFRTARKRNLGLVAATQYIEALPRDVQEAVMANALNKIIFKSSVNSASIHAREFAHHIVKPDTLVNLKAYMAVSRINTDGSDGVSDPMTMFTYPGPGDQGALMAKSYQHGAEIQAISARKYGRSIQQIMQDDSTRRRATVIQKPQTGDEKPWGIGKDAGQEDD